MQYKSVLSIFATLGVSSILAACGTSSGTSFQAPDSSKGKGKNEAKAEVDVNDKSGETTISSADAKAKTANKQSVEETPAAQQASVVNKPQIDPKYANYKSPSQEELNDPTNITLYNGAKEGITSINGQQLAQMVPPGKAFTMPKRYSDIDASGAYNLAIVTESGRTGSASFNPEDVDDAQWKASVSDTLEIKQNAGGGGGAGKTGGKPGPNLTNFVDDTGSVF